MGGPAMGGAWCSPSYRRRPAQEAAQRDRPTHCPRRRTGRHDERGAHPTATRHERLQAYLAAAIANGTANERKAAIEALIAEIRTTEEGVIPVFRIPGPRTPIPGGDGTATIAGTEPVRAMVRSVGLSG